MTEREKMLAGELYDPADEELCTLRTRARMLTDQLDRVGSENKDDMVALTKRLFGSTGENVFVETGFRCDYGCHIHVGENFFANFHCVILDVAEVRFGDNCMLAPQVGVYTATHPVRASERNAGREYGKPITIGDNCWIGGGAIINPGVTLGNNVVVASGAMVTKSFPDNVVIGGNPAKVLKIIEE